VGGEGDDVVRGATRADGRSASGLSRMALFPRCIIIGTVLAMVGGAVFGFVRGLDHLPTLPFAVIEGATLIGVPGSVAGTGVAGLITLGRHLYRARSRSG
jgi:hypothetical protein